MSVVEAYPGWPRPRGRTGRVAPAPVWPWALRFAAIAGLLGAELIHIAVIENHMAEWFWAGIFFFAVAALEGLLAVGLALFPSRRLYLVAGWVSWATIAVWVVTRTVGHPGGLYPWERELIGPADAVATLFALVTAVALAPLAFVRNPAAVRMGRGWASWLTTAVVGGTVALVTVLAVRAPYVHF